ncbi:acyltransferase family protein [Salinibius halmophilus]|uniref:acyltransferase family protein n=1 Tax=Salinibius halmophilus TaxID=1853216 RepID=UPI000E67643D
MERKYYQNLDILRFFCAVYVCLFHYSWKNDELTSFFDSGWIGVQIFFIISGIVISESITGRDLRGFVKSRIIRIYPTLVVCTLTNSILYLLYHGDFSKSFSLSINSIILFVDSDYIASAYWTLPVEISFYTLIAIIFFKQNINAKNYIFMLGLVSGAYNLCNYLGLQTELYDIYFETGLANITLLRHGIYFSIGFFMAEFLRSGKGISLVLIFSLLSIIEILDRSLRISTHAESSPLSIFLVSVFVFTSGLLFLVKLSNHCYRSPRLSKLLRLLGLITFPLYLLHENIGSLVISSVVKITDIQFIILALPVLCSIFIAYLCLNIEKYLRRNIILVSRLRSIS